MSKKWLAMLIVVAVATGIIYYLYFTKPEAFLEKQQIIDEINAFDHNVKINTIEDRVQLDDYNYFVPFITDDGQPGVSYYRWARAKWQLIKFEKSETVVWQLDDKDPSTKYIIWHYPKDTVDYMELYLMKNRSYMISDNEHHYEPKIQLVEKIEGTGNYGALKVSEDFATVMQAVNLPIRNQIDLFGMFYSYETYNLGMNLFKDNEVIHLESGSNGYWTGNVEAKFDFLLTVGESQLE